MNKSKLLAFKNQPISQYAIDINISFDGSKEKFWSIDKGRNVLFEKKKKRNTDGESCASVCSLPQQTRCVREQQFRI